ncbi:hypothetical protein HA402_006264 [Bradysia odoriphaga]|nr:hypothetical protein HA402_006264 [Bradysia odoriphaga]
MTEDLKFIVAEINKILKADYNLISFDSLSIENLLQLLLDVLEKFGAAAKFDVKESDPADTNKFLLDSLKKIQYRPANVNGDPTAFRRLLLQGDKKTIYPILQFIFKNEEKVRNLAYLAQYLIPIDLPPEAMANQEIANLWSEYQLILNEFKEVHRGHTTSRKESAQFKELKNDIGIIDAEKENVKKRLERTQSRLDKIPQQDLLLEAGNALRVERDRQKELHSQLEMQRQSVQKATVTQERLLKELNAAQVASHDAAPQYLLQSLLEETDIARFMVQQKLPQEVATKKAEIQILDEVLTHPSITREYLTDLQEQIDKIGADVHRLLESQLTDRGNQSDNLLPFRQQAATVARNKDMCAEQLDQVTKELRDVENQIRQKQEVLNGIVGGTILRGEELKQYVNMLRTKSSVYKQKRAELAAVKAEASDLQQTLDNLKQQDPTLFFPNESAQDDSMDGLTSRPESPIESRGVTELARLVDGLTRAVIAARERATPLSQQIGPLRLKLTDLKEQRDLKKQVSGFVFLFLFRNRIAIGFDKQSAC